MKISNPLYIAMHNAYVERDRGFYCVAIHPDWRSIFERISQSGYKRPRICIRGISDDDAPRGVIVYDGCYCNVSTPLARDKAVYIEIDGYEAQFARSYSGYKYTMFGDSNTYYCCVSPGCGCVACRCAMKTGIICVGKCDCDAALHSVDAAYMFDMVAVKIYQEMRKSKDVCACMGLMEIVYKSHMRRSEYHDNAIECAIACAYRYDAMRYVSMKPLVRVNWDVMVEKLKQYVDGGRK